ncbi:MAG: hypothetical protein ACKVVT_14275 [Dehalococcoidia bacterium]
MARAVLPGSRPVEDSLLTVADALDEVMGQPYDEQWVPRVNQTLHRCALALEGRLDAVVQQLPDVAMNPRLSRQFGILEEDLRGLLLAIWESRRAVTTTQVAARHGLLQLAKRLRKAGEDEVNLVYEAAFTEDTETAL